MTVWQPSRRKRSILCAFLVVAGALILTIWWSSNGSPRTGAMNLLQRGEIGTPQQDALPTDSAAAPSSLAEFDPPSGTTLESTSPSDSRFPPGITTYTITGRVVDDTGIPWPGAAVRLLPDATTAQALDWKVNSYEVELAEFAPSTTDGNGRFAVSAPWLAVPGLRRYHGIQDVPAVLVEADGMALHVFVVSDHDGADRELGDLVVGIEAASVVARIVDTRGAPIEGATARIYSWGLDEAARHLPGHPDGVKFNSMGLARGLSGTDGRLELAEFWPSTVRITFSHVTHAQKVLEEVKIGRGARVDLGDVVLDEGGTVAGTVRDVEGAPVAGASVWARGASNLGVTVYADEGSEQPDTVPIVVDQLQDSKTWRNAWSPVTTDASGRFVRPGLDESLVEVVIEAPGYEPLQISAVPAGSMNVDAILKPSMNLEVSVIAAATQLAVKGITLKAFRVSGTHNGHMELESERSVAAGARPGDFVVHGVGPRGTRLMAAAPGYATTDVVVAAGAASGEPDAHAEPAIVRLVAESVIEGRVESLSGSAVKGAKVLIARRSDSATALPGDAESGEKSCETLVDGRFQFDSLRQGSFTLRVTCPGYVPPEKSLVELGEGQHLEVPPVSLQPACGVTGTVRDADGIPAAGLIVSTPGGGHEAPVDHKGAYALADLPPGHYAIALGKDSHREIYLTTEIDLADGELRRLDLVLPRFPLIHGFVSAEGRPVAGARLRAHLDGLAPGVRSWRDWTQDCAKDGQFALRIKQEGAYHVWAETPGGGNSAPIAVRATWGLDYPVDFDVGGSSIAGRLIDADDGSVPKDVKLRLLRDGEPATDWMAPTTAGAFRVEPLLPGEYRAQTEGGAYPLVTDEASLRLERGKSLDQITVTVHKGASIDVVVLDAQGQPDDALVYVLTTDEPLEPKQYGAPKGTVRIEGLSSGKYRLVVAGPAYEYMLAETRSGTDPRSLEEASEEVTVGPGEHRDVILRRVQ